MMLKSLLGTPAHTSLTECSNGMTQKLPIGSKFCNFIFHFFYHLHPTTTQCRHPARYVSTNECAGVVRCGLYIFVLNRSNNSKGNFGGCAAVAFRVRHNTKMPT